MIRHSEIKVVSYLSRQRKKLERKIIWNNQKSTSLQQALNIKQKNRSRKERLISKKKFETKKNHETSKKQKKKFIEQNLV